MRAKSGCACTLPPSPTLATAHPGPTACARVPVAWILLRNNSAGLRYGAAVSGPLEQAVGPHFPEAEEERVRPPQAGPGPKNPPLGPIPNLGPRSGPGCRTPVSPHRRPSGSQTWGPAAGLTHCPSSLAAHLDLPSRGLVLGERCRFPTLCSARSRSTSPRSCRTS